MKVKIFDKAGHWVHHDRRDEFIELVRDFLNKIALLSLDSRARGGIKVRVQGSRILTLMQCSIANRMRRCNIILL